MAVYEALLIMLTFGLLMVTVMNQKTQKIISPRPQMGS